MATINLIKQGQSTQKLSIREDINLLSALGEKGIVINALCGGSGKCGKCKIVVDGTQMLACKCFAKDGQTIQLLQNHNSSSEISEVDYIFNELFMVVDLGTTTIKIVIIDKKGSKLASFVSINPQVTYGADVINRINSANNGKLEVMQSAVVEFMADCLVKCPLEWTKKLKTIVVSGNTTMLHILLGKDCKSLGEAPYTPVFLQRMVLHCRDIGLNHDAQLITIEGISTFVGADIVAGICYAGEPSVGKYNILLDLGTNAEIAVYSHDKCYVTAAAAGPCFEGANITCGMSATNGAINKVWIDNGKLCYSVIGGCSVKGLCGTGLVDVVACMLELQLIDETGLFEEGEEYIIAPQVVITQKDIREFQLAKSAIFSGVKSMLNMHNIDCGQIEKMFISGGFSTLLNIENATKVGLVDKQLQEKCQAISNSSLGGAIMTVVSDQSKSIRKIVDRSIYVDLSNNSKFAQEFIDNLCF